MSLLNVLTLIGPCALVRLAHEGYYITYQKFLEFWNTQQFKSLEDKEKKKLVATALVYLEHLGFPKQFVKHKLVADTAKVFLKKEYKDHEKRGILNDIKYERFNYELNWRVKKRLNELGLE